MLEKKIEKIVLDALRTWKTPGAAIAIVRGDEVWAEGYGVKEAGKSDTVTPETLFAIGSISKSFTTTAIAILADERKLSWDDLVRRYLPYFRLADPVADANVTLRDLACHRTGAPRHDMLWYGTDWGAEEIVRRYGHAPGKHPFRTKYEYANIPLDAAGLAVGAASNSTWEDFVRERILVPLKMTSTNFSVDTAKAAPDHATPHAKKKGKLTPIDWWNLDNTAPSGAINSNVIEMSKWMRLHLNDGEIDGTRIVSAEQLRETHKPHMAIPTDNPDKYGFDNGTHICSYCLGWEISDYRGHIILGHSGCVPGFISNLVLIPSLDTGLIVLTNSTPQPTAWAISFGIMDHLLNLPVRNWNADFMARRKAQDAEKKAEKASEIRHKRTRPTKPLEEYAGEYENPAYGRISITLNDGSLAAKMYTRDSLLKHYHYDVFSGCFSYQNVDEPFRLAFGLNAGGEIVSLRWVGIEGVEFLKQRS